MAEADRVLEGLMAEAQEPRQAVAGEDLLAALARECPALEVVGLATPVVRVDRAALAQATQRALGLLLAAAVGAEGPGAQSIPKQGFTGQELLTGTRFQPRA